MTLVTSRFCHFTKSQRLGSPDLEGVEVVLLDEPGYRRNVGIERYRSHAVLCRNFARWLGGQTGAFDLVYSAYPLIETNLILARHLKGSPVPLVIDVQDLWPEAIAGPVGGLAGPLGRAVLAPLTARANRAYRAADAIVAVSQSYLDRANLRHLPADRAAVVYIGADRLWFDPETPPEMPVMGAPLRAVYLGTLGGSYDIETLLHAAVRTDAARIELIGTGPHEARLRALARQIGAPVVFHGALPYAQAMTQATQADVALNAIAGTALQSITNKLSDYICAGLPVLSSQTSPEVQTLLATGAGVSYPPGDAGALARALEALAAEPAHLPTMRKASRALAQRSFLRATSYERIAGLVAELLEAGPYLR